MIYGRFGQPVTILRRAVLSDVQALDNRKPDKHDRQRVRDGGYIVVRDGDKERLYDQCYLRADRGSMEISEALEATSVGSIGRA